mgnify:FL=1
MQVIIDKGIPFLDGVFGSDIEVRHLPPEEITNKAVRNADALVVRTRTRIDKNLLAGSKVRFVATATIGFDHIDQAYCREAGVEWMSCPGCNAEAVCDYVKEALNTLKSGESGKTLGVIGYGHVGKLVAEMAKRKGYEVLVSDPPLGIGQSLAEIAPLCDVLTFHTPLTHEGEHATYHMCNADILRRCKPNALLINAARGGVIDENALLEHMKKMPEMQVVLDCWEGEPMLNRELLEKVNLASFHIAGYSIQGKMRASEMCLEGFCAFFSLPILSINKKAVPLQGDSESGWLQRISDQLKKAPADFEQLRKQYKLR